MTRHPLRRCVLALLWLASADALAARETLSHDELARRLSGMAKMPSTAAVDTARLDAARTQATRDPVVGEWTLRALVVALARQKPDDALRARVEALTRFEPQAWTDPPDPDHARGTHVPIADVAAAARGTLRAWDVAARAEAVQAAWMRGMAPRDGADTIIATAALSALDATRLEAVLAAWGNRLPVEALAAVAARAHDERASLRVLTEGQGGASLAFVAGIADREPTAAALEHLGRAARNPALATAACNGIAALAPRTDAARDALFALLDDPQAGASAAQALAGLGDPATLARVDADLEQAARRSVPGAPPGLATRRRLLILQRLPDALGAPRLARFVADPRQPAALRDEVAGWEASP